MVSMLVWSAVDRGFQHRSDQTKDYDIGICCFSDMPTSSRKKNKDCLARNQDTGNVSEWGDMFIRGLSTCLFFYFILIFISAIRNGERCDPRSDKCLSKFTMCAGVCKCLDFFEHTKDGRCKLPNAGYIGDDCTTRGCQYPSTCVNGICGCQHPLRELSVDEFWVSPQSTLQCRDHDYSLCKYTTINSLMARCARYNVM
jgi:hypothetical protein